MLRRDFLKYTAIAAFFVKVDTIYANNTKSTNVVICGAGFAGMSVAKRIRELNPLINITLIEKKENFISCPFSNAYLGEVQDITYKDLNFDYNTAINKYSYNFINEEIININKQSKEVQTTSKKISYDYLIMTLGIDYDYKKTLNNDEKIKQCIINAPAGLKPGGEHLKLKKNIESFKDSNGENFVMSIPSGPYKCPPGPYERVCLIANYFKENNIKAKVIVLDPREKPAAKAKAFLKVFKEYYPDIVEYKANSIFKDIDFKSKEIIYENFNKKSLKYEDKTINFKQANIIPTNIANNLYKKTGLTLDKNGFVKLLKPTFRALNDEYIYVIGDAQGEYPYPKSAQMANSCALILAQALVNTINKKTFSYVNNLPGNICYSLVTSNKAVSITHFYTYDNEIKVHSFVSDINKESAQAAKDWYKGLTSSILS